MSQISLRIVIPIFMIREIGGRDGGDFAYY